MNFPKFIVKTERKDKEISSIKELEDFKESLSCTEGHFAFLFLKDGTDNVFSFISENSKDIQILDWLNERGVDVSIYIRDEPVFVGISNNLVKAIISKEEMKFAALHENYIQKETVLISIQDPNDKDDLSLYHEKFKDVLSIRFFDVEEDLHVKAGGFPVIPINDEEAKTIAEFIVKNKKEQFIIHCAAGVSRSAGTGVALECILKYNGDKYVNAQFPSDIKNHWRYSPNFVVSDKILENFDPKLMPVSNFTCNSCGAGYDEPIAGLKAGKKTEVCPFCYK